MITDTSVLVVGSSGFLGRQIVELLPPTIDVVPTHCNNRYFSTSIHYDFFKDDIREALDQLNVTMVVFAGAVERNRTKYVQDAMERFMRGCINKRMIYLSSDGVFDGSKGLYKEEDIPAPRTLYGRNLFLCEQLIAGQCPNFCVIRPSYIYGFSNGQLDKRLAHTRNSLEAGEEVILFDDMYKGPLGVRQVAEAVINLGFSDHIGIVHVAGERLSVFDFHHQAMEAIGVNTQNLKHCSMPSSGAYLHDTSLCSSLWQKLTGMKPLSVKQTLVQRTAA